MENGNEPTVRTNAPTDGRHDVRCPQQQQRQQQQAGRHGALSSYVCVPALLLLTSSPMSVLLMLMTNLSLSSSGFLSLLFLARLIAADDQADWWTRVRGCAVLLCGGVRWEGTSGVCGCSSRQMRRRNEQLGQSSPVQRSAAAGSADWVSSWPTDWLCCQPPDESPSLIVLVVLPHSSDRRRRWNSVRRPLLRSDWASARLADASGQRKKQRENGRNGRDASIATQSDVVVVAG